MEMTQIEVLNSALNDMYVATRDHHRGKLPPQMQMAYEKAGALLFGENKVQRIIPNMAAAASAGDLSVPAMPEPECIDSMCMRYDHSFGIKVWNIGQGQEETDEEFDRRRESTRSTMRQLYEEATGQEVGKSMVVRVRVTDEEKASIVDCLKVTGKTESEFIRDAIAKEISSVRGSYATHLWIESKKTR